MGDISTKVADPSPPAKKIVQKIIIYKHDYPRY
jgi:hypothetical protein